jgi:hypothetical protein
VLKFPAFAKPELFKGINDSITLNDLKSRTFISGVVGFHYQTDRKEFK